MKREDPYQTVQLRRLIGVFHWFWLVLRMNLLFLPLCLFCSPVGSSKLIEGWPRSPAHLLPHPLLWPLRMSSLCRGFGSFLADWSFVWSMVLEGLGFDCNPSELQTVFFRAYLDLISSFCFVCQLKCSLASTVLVSVFVFSVSSFVSVWFPKHYFLEYVLMGFWVCSAGILSWNCMLCVFYIGRQNWWLRLGMLHKSSRLCDEILYLQEKGFIFLEW